MLPSVLAARGVFGRLADLVEPLRDGLVRRAVARALSGALGRSGDVSTRSLSQVTHQSEIARDGWAGLVLTLRSFVFTAAGAVTGLLALSPALLLIVLPPLVLGAALFLGTLPPMAASQRAYLAADEAYAAHAGELAASVRDIAAAGTAGRTVAESRALAGAQLAASRSLARWSAVRVVALAVCGRFPPLLLLLGAPWLLRNGLTPGGLVGALTYLTQALAPAVQALMTMLGTAGGRLVVVLDRFTDAPPPPADDPAPAASADSPPPPRNPARNPARHTPVAELDEVTFAYGPRAHPVLDRLSLTVGAGEHLAVVGPSGSGKSTLVAVLAGTERPTGGAVRWRGRPARPADATSVRVLLPQHAYVFTGTLRDNLRYLRPDARDREIAAMADAVGTRSTWNTLLARLGSLDAESRTGPALPGRTAARRPRPRLSRRTAAADPRRGHQPARPGRRDPRRAGVRRPAGRAGRRRPPDRLGPPRRPDPGDGRPAHPVRHPRRTPAYQRPLPRPVRPLGAGRTGRAGRTGSAAWRGARNHQIHPASFARLIASSRFRAPDFRMAAAR
ncbi:membrane translocator [Streptomyces filamentosus NRRL 15998]|uniref:Membrane translocator n=1 Tax=Streptomyces filamentosus NRRL 15998 TaxID=457431 RepID=D6AL07_STRFL|nr:membrane translocator [Streptomyces filamentosus NRRL 15998]